MELYTSQRREEWCLNFRDINILLRMCKLLYHLADATDKYATRDCTVNFSYYFIVNVVANKSLIFYINLDCFSTYKQCYSFFNLVSFLKNGKTIFLLFSKKNCRRDGSWDLEIIFFGNLDLLLPILYHSKFINE